MMDTYKKYKNSFLGDTIFNLRCEGWVGVTKIKLWELLNTAEIQWEIVQKDEQRPGFYAQAFKEEQG